MRYTTAAAFRAALEQRLRQEARHTGLSLSRLRKRVAFELFLRRLLAVAPDRWILKGAFALDLRFGSSARSTNDIDLGRQDGEQAAIEDLLAAQSYDLNDYFRYSAERTTSFDNADDFAAIRFAIDAQLAGRTFESFVVDVGFVHAFSWQPDLVTTSDFLAFAGLELVRFPTIPIVHHLAEKVHAYSRQYGDRKPRSSRPKDLVDILSIAKIERIAAARLREALIRTFQERGTHEVPEMLPPPPDEWRDPYARLAEQVSAVSDLSSAYEAAAGFLNPVLRYPMTAEWDPRAMQWLHMVVGGDV